MTKLPDQLHEDAPDDTFITFSRELLAEVGITVDSLLLISKPYLERRSCVT